MPRAPGGAAATQPDLAEAQSKGRTFLLGILGAVVLIAGGVYWYSTTHNADTRAQDTRDSLRALAAAPAGPDTMTFAAPNDLSPVRKARAMRAALANILNSNRGAVLGWSEGVVDTTVTDRAELRSARLYTQFAKRWHERLDALARDGTEFRYGPAVRMHTQMDHVTNQIRAALSVMRDMVRPLEVKPGTERANDLRQATGYLNAAASTLSNLPR